MSNVKQKNDLNYFTAVFSSKLKLLRICCGSIEASILQDYLVKYKKVADTYILEELCVEYPDKSRRYFAYCERSMPKNENLDVEVPMEID